MTDATPSDGDTWQPEEIEATLKKVLERARTDGAFRAKALEDPLAALQEVSDKPVPASFPIKFHDGSGAAVNIILDEAVDEEDELSDSELEQVAGGARCAASCAASCAVTSTVSIGYPGVGAVGGCV